MASSNQKHWKQILKEAERQGITVEKTANSHYKLTRPDVAEYPQIVFVPGTPSDWRSLRNSVAIMRNLLDFEWVGR